MFGRWLAIIIIAVLVSAAGSAGYAVACSCAQTQTVEAAKQAHDAIFKGVVEKIKKPGFTSMVSSGDYTTTTFKVHEVWKGKVTSEITVYSALSTESCGFEFREGESYIVYAQQTDKGLVVTLCSRTALSSQASEDMAYLESGAVPNDKADIVQDEHSDSFPGYLLTGIIVMTIIMAALIARLYMKSRQRMQ